ncbi:MAG: hypothetical protein ABI210_14655, partial [Abditibacteriaceae bacterium]
MKSFPFSFLACVAFTTSCQAALVIQQTAKAPAKVAATNAVTKAPTKIDYTGEETDAIKDLRQALQGYNAGEIQFEKTDLGARTGQEFYLVR